jgi:hypothetical protein
VLGAGGGGAKAVATQPKAGFETAIPVKAGPRSFKLQALDGDGRVIGTSSRFSVTR